MSAWAPTPPLRDDDIEAADRLLDQADALLRRHRDAPPPGKPTDSTAPQDADDLPILTDMVEADDPSVPPLVEINMPATGLTPAFQPAPDTSPVAPPPASPASSPAPSTLPGTPWDDIASPSVHAAGQTPAQALPEALAEQLVRLDTDLARQIEQWMSHELPQILQSELRQLTSRFQAEAVASLRETLLSELSARIGELLPQDNGNGAPPPPAD